jgi:hypothetical protein
MRKLHINNFTVKDVERANERMILRGKGLLQIGEQRFSVIRVKRPELKMSENELKEAGQRAMRKYVEEF